MLRRINQKLGTAGFIIAIVALVAALGGGAYAASGALTGKQKKEVEKIAKKYAGKPGPAGTTGPAGSPGAKGDAGATGATGVAGVAGLAGAAGAPGAAGKNGLTGFTETLPGEKTETGAWVVGNTPAGDHEPARAAISFSIPLASALPAGKVHYIKSGEPAPTGCTGGTASEPTAEPGNLCVYETRTQFLVLSGIANPTSETEAAGSGATGAMIVFNGEEEGLAFGTWAVTAEVE
jgi:collagen type I alpha